MQVCVEIITSLLCCLHVIVFIDFLCGKCPSSSNHGTALNLIECVSCEEWHIVVFVLICKLSIMSYNHSLI